MKYFVGSFVVTTLVAGVFFLIQPADARVRAKLTPPRSGSKRTKEVDILGAVQNKDGSATLVINACGSKLEVTVDREDIELQNPQIQAVTMENIKRACGE